LKKEVWLLASLQIFTTPISNFVQTCL